MDLLLAALSCPVVYRKWSFVPVFDLLQLAGFLNALICPMIGGSFLLISKLAEGEPARRAERRFLAALVVVTIMTVRTVIACDDAWLLYAVTLSIMIVGALLIPDQDASSVAVCTADAPQSHARDLLAAGLPQHR